jgi:predicted RNA-binding Zn ribbon-like protein
MSEERIAGEFREGMPFLGGHLWIDFLNTTPVIKGVPLDLIGDQQSLEKWARQADIDPSASGDSDTVADLNALRARLAQAFDLLAASEPVPRDTIDDINRRIDQSGMRLHLAERDGLPVLDERATLVGPPVATAVAWDFAQFLGSFDPERMRYCANPACTMQFYDIGKNNRRRWCTMSVCGNRDKVAQYRVRKAGAAA